MGSDVERGVKKTDQLKESRDSDLSETPTFWANLKTLIKFHLWSETLSLLATAHALKL